MIFADILFWFLVIFGAYVVFVAHWIGAYALFPERVERCRAAYGARPVASTLVGLALLVPLLVVAALLKQALPHPVVQIPMLGVLLVVALLCLIGSAGLALRIGAGLASRADATDPWRRVLRGGLVLGAVFVMPFLGWFVLLPWTLVSGLGAFVLTRRSRAAATSPAATETPAEFLPESR
ncbi:MAG: hypothetical protein HZA53_11480 [Planctomycetes bacterium]|nr:hypothetical protein [Planctomycetota bacterium]